MNKFENFLADKGLTMEQFNAKSADEMAVLYNDYNTEQSKAIEEMVANKASKEEVEKALEEVREYQMKQMEQLNSALSEMGLAIKAMSEKPNGVATASFAESLKAGLQANIDNLKNLSNDEDINKAKGSEFSFKTVGDMTIAGNVSGGNVPVEQRLAGLNTIPSRRVRLLDLVSRGVAVSNIISWVYQANKDGAAGQTAEGATKNQIDFDLVVASEAVKKTTAFIKVSTEMLSDIDFIESEIRNELLREVLKKVEAGVYSGSGLTDNLNGIRTVATAFSAGTFAGTVDNANEVDVLTVALNQILIAEQDPATAILMHPSDVTKLKLVKVTSTDKRYVERLIMVAGELMLDGTPIIPTTLVTAGTYLVGDFTKAFVYDKGGLQINIGLDGNDFTKNMRTILAEWRGVCLVKNNDRTAFIKGTFSTDKAALETA